MKFRLNFYTIFTGYWPIAMLHLAQSQNEWQTKRDSLMQNYCFKKELYTRRAEEMLCCVIQCFWMKKKKQQQKQLHIQGSLTETLSKRALLLFLQEEKSIQLPAANSTLCANSLSKNEWKCSTWIQLTFTFFFLIREITLNFFLSRLLSGLSRYINYRLGHHKTYTHSQN